MRNRLFFGLFSKRAEAVLKQKKSGSVEVLHNKMTFKETIGQCKQGEKRANRSENDLLKLSLLGHCFRP